MPPKPKLSREEILDAAVSLVRTEGPEALNARALASLMGCSTQPVFSRFAGMEQLREAVAEEAFALFEKHMLTQADGARLLMSACLGYVRFARLERRLFLLLALDGAEQFSMLRRLMENERYAATVADSGELDLQAATELVRRVFLFAHGLAMLVATDGLPLTQQDVERLLQDSIIGFYRLFSS